MSEYELGLYKIIGEMLRNQRISNNLTLENVANKVQLTPKTIQRYECGERRIKLDTISKLCIIYGIDSNEFMIAAKKKLARPNVDYVVTTKDGSDLLIETNHQKKYYINDDAAELADFMHKNPEYKVLFDASRKIKKEDIEFVKQMLDRFNKE